MSYVDNLEVEIMHQMGYDSDGEDFVLKGFYQEALQELEESYPAIEWAINLAAELQYDHLQEARARSDKGINRSLVYSTGTMICGIGVMLAAPVAGVAVISSGIAGGAAVVGAMVVEYRRLYK